MFKTGFCSIVSLQVLCVCNASSFVERYFPFDSDDGMPPADFAFGLTHKVLKTRAALCQPTFGHLVSMHS